MRLSHEQWQWQQERGQHATCRIRDAGSLFGHFSHSTNSSRNDDGLPEITIRIHTNLPFHKSNDASSRPIANK